MPALTTASGAANAVPVKDAALLEVDHLASGYGDLRAVWDVSLSVAPGGITLLVGRNGAGKSTTLMAIAGLLPVHEGTIRYQGTDLTTMSVRDRVRGGVSFAPEGKRVFPSLTVEKNLLVSGGVLNRKRRKSKLAEVFERFPLLAEHRARKASALSGGQQQVLAIGQALMGDTRLLMLDEPSAGLAPKIFADVIGAVKQLAAEGVSVLLVEQVIDVALPAADRVVLIDRGRNIYATDSPSGATEKVIHDHLSASGSPRT